MSIEVPNEVPKRIMGHIGKRLLGRMEKAPNGCWLWQGYLSRDGYGMIGRGGRRVGSAHKAAYEHWVGEVPEGLELDHICRNRACMFFAHLQPVTHAENHARRKLTPEQHLALGSA